jgi:hypothetical protein
MEPKKCINCKKEGHGIDQCWFLHPHLRPKWWKEKGRVDPVENPKGENEAALSLLSGPLGRTNDAKSEETKEKTGVGSLIGSAGDKITRLEISQILSSLSMLLNRAYEPISGFFNTQNLIQARNTEGPKQNLYVIPNKRSPVSPNNFQSEKINQLKCTNLGNLNKE